MGTNNSHEKYAKEDIEALKNAFVERGDMSVVTRMMEASMQRAREKAVARQAALHHEPVRRVHEPGRNDPCPCGSGKKYKRCCMR